MVSTGGTYYGQINIYEGDLVTETITYDSDTPALFELLNKNIDTDSIEVHVRDSSSSTTRYKYTYTTDITDVTAESRVYYMQENFAGNLEIYFGDGVLGKALQDGNIVTISYRVCNGTIPNGARQFTLSGTIGYNKQTPSVTYSSIAINVLSPASGGQDAETIDQIKFNAPRYFQRQNRTVVEDDYKSYILANHNDIQSINVWRRRKE